MLSRWSLFWQAFNMLLCLTIEKIRPWNVYFSFNYILPFCFLLWLIRSFEVFPKFTWLVDNVCIRFQDEFLCLLAAGDVSFKSFRKFTSPDAIYTFSRQHEMLVPSVLLVVNNNYFQTNVTTCFLTFFYYLSCCVSRLAESVRQSIWSKLKWRRPREIAVSVCGVNDWEEKAKPRVSLLIVLNS